MNQILTPKIRFPCVTHFMPDWFLVLRVYVYSWTKASERLGIFFEFETC